MFCEKEEIADFLLEKIGEPPEHFFGTTLCVRARGRSFQKLEVAYSLKKHWSSCDLEQALLNAIDYEGLENIRFLLNKGTVPREDNPRKANLERLLAGEQD